MKVRILACSLLAAWLGMFLSAGTASADCALNGTMNAEVGKLLTEVNALRRSNGLSPLVLDPTLMQSAQGHACNMARAGTFTHDGEGGAKARMKRAGCRTRMTGENIAMGFASGSKTMDLWLNSPHHKQILLTRNFTRVGLGVATPAPGTFGGPRWVLDVSAGC